MLKRPAFIFVFLLSTAILWGQQLVPPIENFPIFEYNASGKNWGLAVDVKGELFAANNSGLLHYDGEEFHLYKLPNKTIVRSVAVIDDRVFTGSYEEFGYWEHNEMGVLEYVSLTPLITGHEFTSEEFWEILDFEGSIIFRSFSAIYVYANDRITVIDPPFVVSDMVIFEDRLIIAGGANGLFQLVDDELIPIGGKDLLSDKIVTDMIALEDRLLVGTKLHGCYEFMEGKLKVWDSPINESLRLHQLNKMYRLDYGELVFGTIKNGIYLYNRQEGRIRNVNRETGLQNNTVLSLIQFGNQLWAGLDHGLDRLQLRTPITFYTDYSGVVGTVHDVALRDSTLYLGSNTGIHYFQEDRLQFIEGSQGHVWDLTLIGDELFAGHNTGTFNIVAQKLRKISDIAGGYQLVRIPESTTSFMQGTYTGMAKYERGEDGSWRIERVKGPVGFPIKQLCYEDANTVWAAHAYRGLYRLTLNDAQDQVTASEEQDTDLLPSAYNVKLYCIKNQIIVQSEGIWHKYDPIARTMSVFPEFGPYRNMNLLYSDGSEFWFHDYEGTKQLIFTDLDGRTISLFEPALQQRLVPDASSMFKQNDSLYFLTLNDGFARLNLARLQERMNHLVLPKPQINQLTDGEGLLAIDSLQRFDIPYVRARDIHVRISAPGLPRARYRYRLKGPQSLEEDMNTGTLHFQNLPHGAYELELATVGMDNRESEPRIIRFHIGPPWYLSHLSLLGYALALIGVILLVRQYNRAKLQRRHRQLRLRMQREQEEHIAQMERAELEREIKLKQKELARTTMNMANKNELILELKELLVQHKDQFRNRQRYRSLTKKLDNSINASEDWKQFELNFKELHEDFFENLLHQYPDLTPKDLKLCAYLKMNLSSKEIAPLMGITIRGVEIHRYRLRKKLDMDSGQNLSAFLIQFQ